MAKTGSGVLSVVGLLACLASSAFAVNYPTVSMELMTAGSGPAMGGVYTSPYGLSVNGGPTTLLICDDFLTDIGLHAKWEASVLTLADLQARVGETLASTPQTPKFSGPGGLVTVDVVQKYAIAGVLASQLMSHLGSSAEEGQIRGAYSFALWAVFDPILLVTNPVVVNPAHLTTPQFNAANAYLANAKTLVANATSLSGVVNLAALPFASLTIYTPDPLGASQEFLGVSMPEPASIAIMLLDLGGLLAIVALVRRRSNAKATR